MNTLPISPFPPTEKQLGLYPVIDSILWLERLLPLGVKTIQLRIKNATTSEIDTLVQQAVALSRKYQTRLFINDYWQAAIKHHAYGVHLGQEDLDKADLVAIHKAGLRLGVSTHGIEELQRALSVQPSYIAMGHIYPTHSKEMSNEPQGLEELRQLVATIPGYPTVAIGGITLERVPEVLACGVGSIAVISAITQANDWKAATEKLLMLIDARQSGV